VRIKARVPVGAASRFERFELNGDGDGDGNGAAPDAG
jgi:hypothetical protein